MKYLINVLLLMGLAITMAHGQKLIRDDAIRYQQERMVFKQWDKNKFEPEPGFLGLNPLYWITWGLHPNYPDNDLRPLGPYGPQTQRLGLVLAMQNTDNAYKLHADTLRNTALTEIFNYTGSVSAIDPLWMLYYSKEFAPLLYQDDSAILNGVTAKEKRYLLDNGLYSWYLEERHALSERLTAARNTNVDRGSRLLSYHRMLGEYRKLAAAWETGKQRSKLYLALSDTVRKIKEGQEPVSTEPGRKDKQIADRILSKSKL